MTSFPEEEKSTPSHLRICCTWCLVCFCFLPDHTNCMCTVESGRVLHASQTKQAILHISCFMHISALFSIKFNELNDLNFLQNSTLLRIMKSLETIHQVCLKLGTNTLALQAASLCLRVISLGLLTYTSTQGFCVLPYSPNWIYFQQPWHNTQQPHTEDDWKRMTHEAEWRSSHAPLPSLLAISHRLSCK